MSFLYDVPIKEEKRPKTDQFDPTEVRKDEEEIEKPKKRVCSCFRIDIKKNQFWISYFTVIKVLVL